MPRTKRVRTSEKIKRNGSVPTKSELNSYWKAVEIAVTESEQRINNHCTQLLLELNTSLNRERLRFPFNYNKTIGELKKEVDENDFIETLSSRNISANITRTVQKSRRDLDDKNNGNSTVAPRGRALSSVRKTKVNRNSRSLSRTKLQALTSTLCTPAHSGIPKNDFGTVTPKMKLNTPQVVLRRPKQGEIAISMQGSPLMVSAMTTDEKANINIPLQDGRFLSIQPQRGLRTSQIPELDEETRRQIETLRDNLNKVCALGNRR